MGKSLENAIAQGLRGRLPRLWYRVCESMGFGIPSRHQTNIGNHLAPTALPTVSPAAGLGFVTRF